MSKIIKCKCNHEYQDKTYGNGLRVHNQGVTVQGRTKWRCTVCADVKIINDNIEEVNYAKELGMQ